MRSERDELFFTWHIGITKNITLAALIFSVYKVYYLNAENSVHYWAAIYTGVLGYFFFILLFKVFLKGDGKKVVGLSLVPGLFLGTGFLLMASAEEEKHKDQMQERQILGGVFFFIAAMFWFYWRHVFFKEFEEVREKRLALGVAI